MRMNKHKALIILIFSLINLMCKSQSPQEEYINKWKETAIENMKNYKIPASIILAQGILESGNGSSRLAIKANNHFGIKCHSDWTGKKIYHDDDQKGECFRHYENASESYHDHSVFLQKQRYSFLFELPLNDYKGWAHGLKKAGYATNPKYPQLLIDIIEKNNLHELDDSTIQLTSQNTKEEIITLKKEEEKEINYSNEYQIYLHDG